MEAAQAMAARAVKKATESKGTDQPARLLYDAVSKGEVERVRELTIKYANANYHERHRGSLRTPIHQAAELGFLDICKILCEEGQASIVTEDKDGNTPFHLAAARGHFDIVQYFQQRYDPDPSLRNARSYTAFHLAAFGGHLDVIKFLDEEAGVDPHAEDQYWNTAAHHAASRGHLHVLKYLCQTAKLNPSSVNRWKRTPLHRACSHGYTDVAKYLIKQCHCDPTQASLDGSVPLHLAVSNGHLETVQFLIEVIGVPPNPRNVSGDSPLHCAAFAGKADICKFLFEKGHCDVNARNGNGDTPTIVAAIWNQQDVLKYLVEEAHADSCLRNEMGFTAMHMAAREWNQEVCEYICKVAPECARIRDNKGLTPLMVVLNKWGQTKVNRMFLHKEGYSPFHVACEKGFEDMVRYLLICAKDHGELIRTPGDNGDTPLIAVIERNHTRLIDLLLQKGSDVNFRSKNGNTPLLTAIREQNMELTKMLMANDAKINYPTDGDHTPLTLACSIGNMDFVNMLLKAGAKLELPNRNGETALVMACKMRNMDLINALLLYGSQVNYPTDTRFTPLIAACIFGEVEMVSLLISKGAIIDMPNIKKGTPLAAASKRGKADIVRLILNHMLNRNLPIDVAGLSGDTPVMKAAMHGHADVVKMLIDSGASIFLPDAKGNTPAIEAARKKHSDVLKLLVEQGADVDAPGENGNTARAFTEADLGLNASIREGLNIFFKNVHGPVEKLHRLGYLNDAEPVQDGFYFGSEVLPVSKSSPKLSWGKMIDPRNFPVGTLDGAIIALDSRRDPALSKKVIVRAQQLVSVFPNGQARASALAMFIANDCGGAAIVEKVALSRASQCRLQQQCKLDVLSIGELMPGFGISRMRSIFFKYIAQKIAAAIKFPLHCRVVSRPSSGSGWDQIDHPWPCTFTWAEVAFDEDGPYFVVDQMHDPGALLFENTRAAAIYRSGIVFHDQPEALIERVIEPLQEINARETITRFVANKAFGKKKKGKKGKKKKKGHTASTSAPAGKEKKKTIVSSPTLANIAEATGKEIEKKNEIDNDANENNSKNGDAKEKCSDSEAGTEKADTVDTGGDSPSVHTASVAPTSDGVHEDEDDVFGDDVDEVLPGNTKVSLEKEEEENSLALAGSVDWMGIWSQQYSVFVTRYPVPSFYNEDQREEAAKWFKMDVQNYAALRHRCIDRPLGVDTVSRSIIRNRNSQNLRLDEYIKENHTILADHHRLSVVMQIAETMEYLHTLDEPIIHGRLRIKDITISGVNSEDGRDRPMIHLPDIGLPRRVEPIIGQHPFIGAAVYYPPERLAMEDAEGPLAKDSKEADVYAFGVVAAFVASGVLPWADFQARDLREFFKAGKQPQLPDDNGGHCETWKEVLIRIFEPDPAERPSFTQVIRLFNEFAGVHHPPGYQIPSSPKHP